MGGGGGHLFDAHGAVEVRVAADAPVARGAVVDRVVEKLPDTCTAREQPGGEVSEGIGDRRVGGYRTLKDTYAEAERAGSSPMRPGKVKSRMQLWPMNSSSVRSRSTVMYSGTASIVSIQQRT